jgi:hypothetical protein
MTTASLERRLANFRSARVVAPSAGTERADRVRSSTIGAERLAASLDGELVRTAHGSFVRVEPTSVLLPVDRERLALLPGQPPAAAPLLCLDTETTGLATAAGTLAFLVGLGWWEGPRFRQVQLLLPDHADEPALLSELARFIPTDGWLVTYNGRGFDWPLLVARYRLGRRTPPEHAGHLDLLPLVRRVFRHRMPDARLRTAETVILGLRRIGDVDGWEIPGRYLEFLRDGEPSRLVEVVRHNHEDVRSLGRLVAHVDDRLADTTHRAAAPVGDLAGLARAFARERRFAEALACLEAAEVGVGAPLSDVLPPSLSTEGPRRASAIAPRQEEPWWSPRSRPDFGGRPHRYALPGSWRAADPVRLDATWTGDRLDADRARLLRRLGRHAEAEEVWLRLGDRGGSLGLLALIEVAKIREHRRHDPAGAMAAVGSAVRIAERLRAVGRPVHRVEADLARRSARLRRKIAPPRAPRAGTAPAADRVGDDQRGAPASDALARTAARSATPASPGASTASDAAAAARRSAPEPIRTGTVPRETQAATSAARNTSPAPVGSTVRAGGIAG